MMWTWLSQRSEWPTLLRLARGWPRWQCAAQRLLWTDQCVKSLHDLQACVAGQERSILPTAEHTACTIEMTNLQKRVDLAVIDEIQVTPLRST